MNKHLFYVTEEEIGQRLDKDLVIRFPDLTRNYLQKVLEEGCVTVNGKIAMSRTKLKLGDKIYIKFPPLKELTVEAKDIPLDIVFENKDLLVINKPAGMVVHPGTGESHISDSLVNAVLHHCKGKLSGISGTLRPGIVHRLDKDTSGLLVVAKNDKAHQSLAEQFKKRLVKKTYFALIAGHLQPTKGMIDAPIGRDSRDRKKMAVTNELTGRASATKYKVLNYFDNSTFIEVDLLTGRTHQIRVHFASIGFPLVGDALYGRPKVNRYFSEHYGLNRVFLHAGKLQFVLPSGKDTDLKSAQKKAEFEVSLPSDLMNVITELKKSAD